MRVTGFSPSAERIVVGAFLATALLVSAGAATANAQPWTAVGATGVVVSGKLAYDCADQAIGFFSPRGWNL